MNESHAVLVEIGLVTKGGDVPAGMIFVDERRPKRSLSLFLNGKESGRKALLIARNEPGDMASDEELEDVECHRLLLRETEGSIRPSDLEAIEKVITSFFERNDGGVALLDGLEMLTLFNDLSKVTEMLNKAQAAADGCGGAIVIPIDNRVIQPEVYRRISEDYTLLDADDSG